MASRFSLSSALSFFGPSLETPFCSCVPQALLWPLLTPQGLSTSGSPRVSVCSFRSRLWALQNAVSDSWASRVLACSPPTSCLTAHLCSFGRTFAFHPFAPAPCGDDLAVRLRLAPQAPGGNLSSLQTRPLPGTLAALCDRRRVYLCGNAAITDRRYSRKRVFKRAAERPGS